ncbi:MAG: rRNA maturation RNase YbeY [Bacillota bacterium]|nr:MAG: rRNA maturation RNase YbeY [Bacillota bacterium]
MGRLVIECLSKNVHYRRLAREVYKILGQKGKLRAELVFLGEDEMMRLNSMARHVDKVTDVLSFPSLDGIRGRAVTAEEFPYETEGNFVYMGSIAICEKRAEEQAAEYGHSAERETAYLVLHGLLHLFGYDHMTDKDKGEMRALEKAVIEKLYPESVS